MFLCMFMWPFMTSTTASSGTWRASCSLHRGKLTVGQGDPRLRENTTNPPHLASEPLLLLRGFRDARGNTHEITICPLCWSFYWRLCWFACKWHCTEPSDSFLSAPDGAICSYLLPSATFFWIFIFYHLEANRKQEEITRSCLTCRGEEEEAEESQAAHWLFN